MSNSAPTPVGDTVAPPSASAIVAEAVAGSHVLKIKGYSLTKRLGSGKCLKSETFTVGGHGWYLSYYPNGCSLYGVAADWIAFKLYLDDNDVREVIVQYTISLLDQDGEPVPAYVKDNRSLGLIKRKDLEESVYLRDDVFSVRCDLTVSRFFRVSVPPSDLPVAPSDMHLHLGGLLSGGEGTDVTFEVGGETFDAHRWMLAARSSIFKAELFGSMKEKTDTCVRIDDMEAKVFKAMLHFVYTDSLPHIDESDATAMAQHLLVGADRYNLGRLKSICEDMLCRYIDASTAATTLALAEQHGCRGLKDACFKFLASPGNLKAVMASDGFGHLMKSCTSLHKELAAKLP